MDSVDEADATGCKATTGSVTPTESDATTRPLGRRDADQFHPERNHTTGGTPTTRRVPEACSTT